MLQKVFLQSGASELDLLAYVREVYVDGGVEAGWDKIPTLTVSGLPSSFGKAVCELNTLLMLISVEPFHLRGKTSTLPAFSCIYGGFSVRGGHQVQQRGYKYPSLAQSDDVAEIKKFVNIQHEFMQVCSISSSICDPTVYAHCDLSLCPL